MLNCCRLTFALLWCPVFSDNCWWTGCQPYTWAVRGCNDNNYVETSSKPCTGGDAYQCCRKGSTVRPNNNDTGNARPGGESGKCSYYGAEAQGGTTASGDTFDYHKMTAAHRTLRFGTRIKVTNRNNGKAVFVVVNDRGPCVEGRIVDLSQGAFEKIANAEEGVIPCSYIIVS